jgi:hypothetical protein
MNGDDNLYDEDGSGMAKPQIIKSPLSRVVEEGGVWSQLGCVLQFAV